MKNGSFFKSQVEDLFYEGLCDVYGSEDVVRLYKDWRYAKDSGYKFECDLYVKSKDCFIEIQGYKSHGKHPSTGKETAESLELTEKEFITYRSDVLKRSIAKKNGLKYREVFPDGNYGCYKGERFKEKLKEFIEGDYDIWYGGGRLCNYSENTEFI